MIVDNFLDQDLFADLRQFADEAPYRDEKNPEDGVVYPCICKEIPRKVEMEIVQLLAIYLGKPLIHWTMFLRLSLEGAECPHQAHSDYLMGEYSLMLYLNREEDCQGGTSLVRHAESGITYTPEGYHFKELVMADQNHTDKWAIDEMAEMRPNRGFLFDAKRLHRAEPVGGFGDNSINGRLVLTCFFS